MKKFLPILLAIVIAMGNVSTSFAKECPLKDNYKPKRGEHSRHSMTKEQREKKKQEFIKKLGLNEDQQKQMHEIHMQSMKQAKPLFEKKMALKKEIRAMKESGASKEELKSKVKEIKELHKQMKNMRKENNKKVEAILNKEQQKTFKKMREEHEQKRKEWRNKHREKRKQMRKERLEENKTSNTTKQ